MKTTRAILVLTFLCMIGLVSASHGADERPNVLLILADDLGFSDLACYGGEIQTPNLDGLASNGVRLTRFYSTGRCCPSRASIMTGLYPHRAGIGHMVKDLQLPGYRGHVSDDAVTIAEALKPAGYRTYLAGKWHLGTNDPTRHGFEEFYGTLVSAQTFWDPNHYIRLPQGRLVKNLPEGTFYGTNALTDQAIEYLNDARKTPNQPWFIYLAYNAPHFPLQAPNDVVQKYVTRYRVGWDAVRDARLARMKSMGLVPDTTTLTPRSPYNNYGEVAHGINPAWTEVPEDRKNDLIQRMAIYAAMVDIMDQNIGRMIAELKSHNEFENTLILFASDNGACAEWDPWGFDGQSGPNNILHTGDQLSSMGLKGTYHSAGSGWANASNTPWRLYKHYNHEGGISSPCIIHWPAGISRRQAIDHRPGHLIDVMPTLLDATKATYPTEIRGNPTAKLAGQSILPVFRGENVQSRTLFFEHEGNRAVIEGRWKLTALKGSAWELYDIEQDRTELNDLAHMHSDIVNRLNSSWNDWAINNWVTPAPTDYQVPYLKAGR